MTKAGCLLALVEGKKKIKKLNWKALKKRLAKMKKVRFRKKPTKAPKVAASNFIGKMKKKVKGLLSKLFKGKRLTESSEEKIEALATYLDVDSGDIEDGDYAFEVNGEEYLVLTDSEADEAAGRWIEETVWAFNTDFLLYHISVDKANEYHGFESYYYDEDTEEEVDYEDADEVFYMGMEMSFEDYIKDLQKKCENGNDDLVSLMGGDINTFIRNAIDADGRGHFIASYDGEEGEEGIYFIYRTN